MLWRSTAVPVIKNSNKGVFFTMIIFDKKRNIIKIHTQNTTYVMQIVCNKYVAHLYYGKRTDDVAEYTLQHTSFAPYYEEEKGRISMDWLSAELSFFGCNDMKDTAVRIKNANGDSSTFFQYRSHRVFKGRFTFDDMPYSRGGEETLELTYEDSASGCVLYSYYKVFPESDTITRYLRFENKGTAPLKIERALVCQLDLPTDDYVAMTLCGTYFDERHLTEIPVHVGVQSIYSTRGHSSHDFNPFLAIKTARTTEYAGDAYAMEFVYSGDFTAQAEKTFKGNVRLMMGLNRDTFAWNLHAGETFTTPEVILTCSSDGTNTLSRHLHDHIRQNIVPEKFASFARPVVLNTWEAMAFSIDESNILAYAKQAKAVGIDTVVVDDGWFAERCHDDRSLGDWYANTQKFPNGLKAFAQKIRDMGLKIGFWIEPEMISENSELYRCHPEWALQCKDRAFSRGRMQLVLDMTNDEAIRAVVDGLLQTFKDVPVDYIKWDFNRSLAETGSLALPAEQQCEAKHRFVLGSYKMHKMLTEAFPDVLFEGCCGGGGRFDAGILFYCPQIWTSDNTDPVARLDIQKGTAFAYPLSAISAHVSNSQRNTLEKECDYEFRFNVAAQGVLGYEMDITRLTEKQKAEISAHVEAYRALQPLLLNGDCYRIEGLSDGEYGVNVVSKDGTEFVLFYQSVNAVKPQYKNVIVKGLCEEYTYEDERGCVYFGKEAMYSGIALDLGEKRFALLRGKSIELD